jgi:putative NADH-flavin reductase
MRISVFGAAGKVGSRIVGEALSRGHDVTAVVRNPARFRELSAAANARVGDAANPQDVVQLSLGQDVVVNATRPLTSDAQEVLRITRTLMDGLASTGARLLIVGGAASLRVPGANGRMVIDDPKFLPPSARQIGQASFDQFEACRSETRVDWTYLSPPAELLPGVRTGEYRLGGDELLLDQQGRSRISMEDLAVALLDEVEQPRHHQTRFTAAY